MNPDYEADKLLRESHEGRTTEQVEIIIPQPKGYRALAVVVQNTGTMFVDEEMESFVHRLHEFINASTPIRMARTFDSQYLKVNAIGTFAEKGEGPGLEGTTHIITSDAWLSRVGAENISHIGYTWMEHGPMPRQSSIPVARSLPFQPHGQGKRQR
jgi:hypothetical protein